MSLWAAFGEFGSPLFWARCVPSWTSALGPHDPTNFGELRDDGFLRDGDGGLYWLMAMVLPVFHTFRYPSKLLSFTVLALAGLAGLGWDRVRAGPSRRGRNWALGLLIVTLAALAGDGPRRRSDRRGLARSPAAQVPSTFGPFQPRGAVRRDPPRPGPGRRSSWRWRCWSCGWRPAVRPWPGPSRWRSRRPTWRSPTPRWSRPSRSPTWRWRTAPKSSGSSRRPSATTRRRARTASTACRSGTP